MTVGSRRLEFDPPYNRIFAGLLSFADFQEAEKTLRNLEILRQRFQSAGDKTGVDYCRRLAMLGRRRAGLISRNLRVSLRKRLQKKELEFWFRVWLETPEIFEDWLTLRKESEEFQRLQQSVSSNPKPKSNDAPST